MHKSFFLCQSLMLLLGVTFSVYAENEKTLPPAKELVVKADSKVYDPNILSMDSLQLYEKSYNYDWNNFSTIDANKNKANEIEKFLESNPPVSTLNKADQHAYGKLLYKLGTYYTHITRETDLAIYSMKKANEFLKTKEEKAWNEDHLAYAYEIKFYEKQKIADKDQALKYAQHVLSLYPKAKNKIVAFAYCIQGLLEANSKNFGYAENHFNKALEIYEKIPDGKDDQYARAKNRLAEIKLTMNDHDQEAISMFEELEKYWENKGSIKHNPYAARNLISLSAAYLKLNNPKDAIPKLRAGIEILQTVYGDHSSELIKPYQLLKEAYAKSGEKKLADLYQTKLSSILMS